MDPFPLGHFSVARIGFGAIQLPGPGAFGPPRDRDTALAVLRRAVELGVNHIDTAQFYGPKVSNELIREALHPYPADLALVSKVGARRDDAGGWVPLADPADFRADIEANLRTLDVDQLAVKRPRWRTTGCLAAHQSRAPVFHALLELGSGGIPRRDDQRAAKAVHQQLRAAADQG